MAYRELGMVELREIVRRWQGGEGVRAIARGTGLDRKTIAEYLRRHTRAIVALPSPLNAVHWRLGNELSPVPAGEPAGGLELRAAMSLAHLLAGQGKRGGFKTVDRAAKQNRNVDNTHHAAH